METDDADASAQIRVELDTRIHFALQQNDIAVVKAVHIDNQSDQPLVDLKLRVTSEPGFADPYEIRVAYVDANKSYNLKTLGSPYKEKTTPYRGPMERPRMPIVTSLIQTRETQTREMPFLLRGLTLKAPLPQPTVKC